VFYYYYNRDDLQAVRYKNWKLVLPHKSLTNTMPGKDSNPGKTAMIEVPMALFDLAHDPGEHYDVQENYPEMVAKIQALAQKAREDLGDDLTGVKGTGVRPSAQIR
jgi:arylsulfatase A-like enzyme